MAELIPCLIEGTSLDTRLEVVHQIYLQWKSLPVGMRLHYRKLDRETFGLTSLQVQPKGAWTKFNDTRILFKFFQYFMQEFPDKFVATPITRKILEGLEQANLAFGILYRGGVWLSREEARSSGDAGLAFLRCYGQLAHSTLAAGRTRFVFNPKCHYVHHSFLSTRLSADTHVWTVNPVLFSVQIDEDYVGRVSRFSRRVGHEKQMERTIGRVRVASQLAMDGE